MCVNYFPTNLVDCYETCYGGHDTGCQPQTTLYGVKRTSKVGARLEAENIEFWKKKKKKIFERFSILLGPRQNKIQNNRRVRNSVVGWYGV
jgi:hypothetical protein